MPYRFPFAVLAVLAAFAGGFASSHLFERSAHALTSPFASSIYVPADGLAFRTFEGRVIARLTYDRRGGVFDVYDGEEHPSTGVRAAAPAAPPAPSHPERVGPSPRGRGIDWGF